MCDNSFGSFDANDQTVFDATTQFPRLDRAFSGFECCDKLFTNCVRFNSLEEEMNYLNGKLDIVVDAIDIAVEIEHSSARFHTALSVD